MTKIKPVLCSALMLSTAFSLVLVSSAQGQDNQAASPPVSTPAASGGIEEVVVTAQRRQERVQDVPVSVTAFTGASLDSKNVVTTADLVKITPGLQFGSGSLMRNELSIRGIESNRFDVAGESSSGVFVDDVYQPRFSNLLFDLLDVERVEILKGPQGTLYGRNTIGGAIAVYTPEPDADFHVNTRFDVGSKDEHGATAAVSGPLTDQLFGSLSLGYRSRAGFMTDTVTGKDNGISSLGGRAKLVYKPIDNLKVTFTAGAFNSRQDADLFDRDDSNAFLVARNVGPDTSRYSGAYTTPGGSLTRLRLTDLRLDYQLQDITLTSISAFQYNHSNEAQDQDSSIYDGFSYRENEQSRAISQELRANGTPDGALSINGHLKWVGGLYFFQEEGEEATAFDIGNDNPFVLGARAAGVPVPANGVLDTTSKNLTTRSYAAFGQATYALTPEANLTFGARYTRDRKSFAAQGITTFPGVGLIASDFLVHASKSWGQFTPKVSVDYHFTPDVMAYFTYSEGYKSGAPESVSFDPVTAAKIVNPETLTSYEIGLKTEFLDRRFRFNVAAFDNKFDNLQVRRIIGGVPQIDNAATSTIRGGEVEASILPIRHLRFDIGYNYLQAKYDQYVSGAADLSGHQLPRSPHNTATINGQYSVPLDNQGTITVGALFSWSDKFYFQPENTAEGLQPAYSTTDASLSYDLPDGRTSATLWVKNLFDKEYRTYFEVNGNAGRQVWGDRTTFGLTLRYTL